MGSQTLEILRNCLASFTVWFFDPHQTVFCNAVHLYVWLFLLCMPFISYLYFTTTYITWGIYCITVAILMAVLKIINLGLHSMYDKAQAMSDVNLKKSSRGLRETSGDEDAGIEMQVLGSSDMPSRMSVERQSDEVSCGNSAISIDYLEPSSTIDFKVDVHRKNSSESSDSVGIYPKTALQTSIVTHCAEVCPTSSHRRQIKPEISEIEGGADPKELGSGNLHIENDLKSELAGSFRKPNMSRQNRHESLEKEDKKRSQHGKLQRQISLDSEQMAITESSSKLQRHRSSDCNEERQKNKSNVSLTIPHHHHQIHNHSRLQSLENYTTKSELAIENIPSDTSKNYLMQKSTPMRRDSNSTMSALQLPTASSSSSSRIRRHSNTGGKGMSGSTSVRRIKSAALETCCPQQSVSNLTPHPNSIEVISGQALRNPQHTVLPLPSKCLSRNPHLNLFPKSSGALNKIDPVYPIEELADEGASGRSLNEEFKLNQDSESDEDEDSHSATNQRQSITESESDIDRPQTQSTDSDTENNGSRSPLLEIRNRASGGFISDKPVILSDKKTKTIDSEKSKTENCDKKSEESEGGISSDCEQASAGSKDMLLTDKEIPQYITLDLNIFKEENVTPFSIFKEDSNVPLDVPIRSLGAIPKSRTRSHSSRRFSAEDHCRPSRNIALPRRAVGSHLPQTPTAPVLTFLNARSEHPIIPIYPSPTTASEFHFQSIYRFRPRAYAVVEHNRHRQPKIRRSTRSKHQHSSSFDGGNTSKDDQNEITPPMTGLGSFEKIIKRSIDNSLSLERFMEEAYGYDIPSTERSVQTAILNIGRVEFNETTFPDFGRHYISTEKPVQPKRYYRFPIYFFGKKDIKISMDRLQLLALFDRDSGWLQVILAIILTIFVSVLGSIVLQKGFYDDIFAFIFCFVIAGCQYSLLKSVQPDAASPIHGFNKTVAYSRPIYFCLCSSLLLIGHHFGQNINENDFKITIFGLSYIQSQFFKTVQYILSIVLLLFPVFFSLGLFPQINTFLIYFLEQIDMHIFGGNAVSSLLAAFISIIRSIIACLVLYGPAFGGLSEPRGTQHILFSIFCSLLIPVSYHLSRSASDFSCVWNLIKSSVIFHPDDDDEDEEDNNERSKETKSDTDQRKEASSTNEINENKNVEEFPEGIQEQNLESELIDPLPKKLQTTVNTRLKNDLLICSVLGVIVMSLHSSTIFTVLQPDLNLVLYAIAMVLGLLLHYIIPQMRKHLPWLCLARPLLRQNEHGQFEAKDASVVMWFESTYICLCFLERNVLYPLIFLSALTADSMTIAQKFGVPFGAAIVAICGLKCIRSSYSDPSSQYLILTFSFLCFRLDFKSASETFLIDYFIVAIIFKKTCEFLLKMQFVVTYIAPWQITWGSAFHAFAQPFSVPHSAMLFLQAAISAILSTPLNPFLGSAIFLTSYVRPIKFWERDYNTKRIDHSNTRLSSQLERDLGADDNNLNSIFYEHLTRSLQHSLCGDLLLGRWGNVSQGDCFVLASDYLNCLVHIIELGNGLCTFQLRGLEFRGTYCQQREVEAISEGVEDNDGCCCCSPGHLPRMLSANAMFSTRWLAWQVVAAKYVLEGYSISDNSAIATLQVFEFRKVLITYYVKSIIYYIIRSNKLNEWLISRPIQDALLPTLDRQFVDLDPIFNHNLDDDYDFRSSGVTRNSFCSIYLDWIQFCCIKRQHQNTVTPTNPSSPRSSSNPTPSPRDGNQTIRMRPTKTKNDSTGTEEPQQQQQSTQSTAASINMSRESPLVSLCLSLALLARRTLATASHSSSTGVEFFLHGLHALFKGDFRITSPRDEWVFADMELLHGVVAPAVRMSLKLHQDHFLCPEEYEDPVALYDAIGSHSQELVISHEADPLWRNAVLRGAPNLLALRHVMEDGSDEYRVIRLTKRYLSFRVIKLNRECVRGLWAGQQQELIYLRNRNPERGSIQNAKQALRNIINSSCDQPIGYPIYVSPLTTSYAETNEQLCSIIGGAITLEMLQKMIFEFWNRVRQRCREGCSSGSALEGDLGEIQGVYSSAQTPSNTLSGTTGTLSYGSQNISITGAGLRGSLASMAKPTSSTLIAGLLNRERDPERESIRDRGTSKRTASRSERERRATLPGSNRETSKENMGSTNSSLKLQESIESCNATAASPNQKSNNSSSVNLNVANNNSNNNNACSTNNKKLLAGGSSGSSTDRKSFERTPSNKDKDEYDEQTLVIAPSPPNIVLNRQVFIYDVGEIYDCLDLGRRIDVIWPNEQMRASGGRSSWKEWTPLQGMIGFIVHYWQPNHTDCHFRSNVNRTILLIQIGDRYVPIGEKGVREFTISDIDENFTTTNIPEVHIEEETENHNNSNNTDKTNINEEHHDHDNDDDNCDENDGKEVDEKKVCDESMMWSNEYYAYVVFEK